MHSRHTPEGGSSVDLVDLLDQAVTAVDNWRNQAAAAGIRIQQVNLQFPDLSDVLLVWDDASTRWKITTQS